MSLVNPIVGSLVGSLVVDLVAVRFIPKNINFFGASIMNGAFNLQTTRAEQFFAERGLSVNVIAETQSGASSGTYVTNMSNAVVTHAALEDVLVVIHGSGNDVTTNRPYATASQSTLDNIDANMRATIQTALDAGWVVNYGGCTWRNYADVPPDSNGSEPFNNNLFYPIIQDLTPNAWNAAKSAPMIDYYNFTKLNSGLLSGDGVHPVSSSGDYGFAGFVCNQLSKDILSIPDANYAGKTFVIGTNTYVNNSGDRVNGNINNGFILNSTVTNFSMVDTNGITVNNLGFVLEGTNVLANTEGRGNSGDTSNSLTNDALLSRSVYTSDDSIVNCQFSGLPVGATGVLSITASRDTTATDRRAEYTYDGVTKELDAAAVTPEIITFNFTVDADGKIPFTWKRKTGDAFAYFSGAQITFD